MIGTSGQPGKFTKQIVDAINANTDQPVILPLSNPTAKVEAIKANVAGRCAFSKFKHHNDPERLSTLIDKMFLVLCKKSSQVRRF